MEDSRNVCKHGPTTGKANLCNLSLCRVWFFWFNNVDSNANTFSEWRSFECWNFRGLFPSFSWRWFHKLSKGWHNRVVMILILSEGYEELSIIRKTLLLEPIYPSCCTLNDLYLRVYSFKEYTARKIWNMKKAGVEGIEPSHVGTKNRCLTTWLYSTWCVWSLFVSAARIMFVSTIKYEERDFCVVHECGRDFLVERVLCTKMRKQTSSLIVETNFKYY